MNPERALALGETWVGRGFVAFPVLITPEIDEHGVVTRLEKKPLTQHGHLQATRDVARLRQLFDDAERRAIGGSGTMGVGVVPGSGGAIVVDADIKGGIDGPAKADEVGVGEYWPTTTPSGGAHRWCTKPTGMGHIRNGNGRPWTGIDIRGDDGWVVAPGTTTPWGDWIETHPWPVDGRLPVLADAPAETISIHLNGTGGGGGWGGGGMVATSEMGRYDPAVHDAQMHPITLRAHQVLAEEWGMDPTLSTAKRRDDTGEVFLHVTRPGKSGGTSATLGYLGPGVLYVFTSDWPGLESATAYDLADLDGTAMTLEEMEEIAAGLIADLEEHLAEEAAIVVPEPSLAPSTGGGGGGSGTAASGGGGGGGGGSGGSSKPPALMVRMVRLVQAEYLLFIGDDAREYAVSRSGGHIAEQITGSFVMRSCWSLGVTASYPTAASQAAAVLQARAFEGPRLTLSLRAARWNGGLVLDLADPDNARCVIITESAWWVAEVPPEGVYFRRSSATRQLPEPIHGGTYDVLQKLTGFGTPDDARWLLIRGWLAAALLPDIPRPLLLFLGAAGSAKTTRAWMVVSILDPKPDGTLGSAFSKDLEDDQVKALANYLPSYDNLGKVSAATSDHLARMVTGEAGEKRRRYSDDELAAVNYRRTGVLTAITMPPVQPDTVARLIAIECGRVPETLREPERKLWTAWHAAHPELLGAVLDDLVTMLAGLPKVTADDDLRLPRMADYFQALYAVDPELAAAYQTAQGEVLRTAAEVDPFVRTLREWLTSVGGTWEGEPTQAWEEAGRHRFTLSMSEDFGATDGWWPKTMAQFTSALARTEEPLSAIGITVHRLKVHGRRQLVLDYKSPE